MELVARGADEERREAERWLARGNPLQARVHAQAVLSKVPGSPIGLALLVDACEASGLDSEAIAALGALCASAPWRGELWVRLGQALRRVGAPRTERSSALQRALDPAMDSSARRVALLELADLDLEHGDPVRAMRWLDSVRLQSAQPDVALRNLEVGLAIGDRALVEGSLGAMGQPDPLDGRGSLACGRARAMLGDPSALDLLLRAFILEAPGAAQALSAHLASCTDAVHVSRVRELLRADGREHEPMFALSLALAEGRSHDAQAALVQIAAGGDRGAARTLYEIAVERSDLAALRTSLQVLGPEAPHEGRALVASADAVASSHHEEALSLLDGLVVADAAVRAWAHALRTQVYRLWAEAGDAGWGRILVALRRVASAWERLELVEQSEALSIERRRPLRVAIVGEFNAGKSTFINALIGADVAPTGVLPTTATLHWLAWAQDPFARIMLEGSADRIVPHEGLKAALREIHEAGGPLPRQVDICAPIERLKRIELLDTPGFNAPDPAHARAAHRALQEAHLVLWVFDAAQPVKDSERNVLATIAQLGVPVQVLVNKSDRVAPRDLPGVLQHVDDGLTAMGVRSLAAVTAMSARLALAGRLGDADAYARSGWEQVELLLSAEIVNRSEELRARAVRRKAGAIAAELAAEGSRHEASEEASGFGQLQAEAARLSSLDQQACERLVGELGPAAQQLEEDLRPVRLGSIPEDDLQARAYAEARVMARLAEPMAAAIARAASLPPELAEPFSAQARLVLRGVAAADPRAAVSWRVVHACALAASEWLVRPGRERAQAGDDAVRAARMAALASALG